MTTFFRSFAVSLAFGAMLLRAMLPAGWMPNTDGIAGAPLVICSVDGLHHVLPHQAPGHRSQDDHGFACPFAAAAHLAPPQQALTFSVPLAVAFTPAAFARIGETPAAIDPGHAPRGPPVSV